MSMTLKIIRMLLLLAVMAGGIPLAHGQRVVSVHVDSVCCIGDSLTVSVGYKSVHNVVVENAPSSISLPQRTFLPDGQVCDSSAGTCTYRSSIHFSPSDRSTLITSVQDIDFVRLNIEHSFIGDIFIALECPNGQFVSLMNAYRTDFQVTCGEPKFAGLKGWDVPAGASSGSVNAGPNTFLVLRGGIVGVMDATLLHIPRA